MGTDLKTADTEYHVCSTGNFIEQVLDNLYKETYNYVCSIENFTEQVSVDLKTAKYRELCMLYR